MVLDVKIKLLTKFLGDSKEANQDDKKPKGMRGFRRLNGELQVPIDTWKRNLESAAAGIGIKFQSNWVALPNTFTAKKFIWHTRKYNKTEKENFEAIPEGEEITITIILQDQHISKEDFLKILTTVGSHYGWSPFGNKFQYGRFEVVGASEQTLGKLNIPEI